MNLNQLTIFHVVAERLSFTRAAKELHLTQPGISKHIAALEEYYGTPLFHRIGRRVSLTQAGEILHEATGTMTALLDETTSRLDDLKGLAGGKLQVGAGVTIAAYLLPRMLTAFKKQAPGVELTVETGFSGEIVELVLATGIELGLVGQFYADPRLVVRSFHKDPLVLIVPPGHRWVKRKKAVALAELAAETFLISKRGSGTWRMVSALLEESGTCLGNTMELGTTEGVKQAVAAGLGISILSRHVLERELATGSVLEIPMVGTWQKRELYLIYRKDRYLSQAARAFLTLLPQVLPAP
ncbi:LysR family transcriptional regulator [Geomonas silvestris]|uniref:LysR family transcriptional regulator n=1 Tax=Geomonas silvestris TaxID=2740184 RepID=A0A6V8MRC8_9BACT|nr:LysR family transcriptional regulator [Geomonas silvestris]GFO62069.1 LysR family transcriptional regulator [Geomonas silvestris]